MTSNGKRKRPPAKGLAAGERLKRDNLAGAEHEYSQWGWVSRITEPSQITLEHKFAACGFTDKINRPLCKNIYSEPEEPQPKRLKIEVAPKELDLATGEDVDDIIVISSDEDEHPVCTNKKCKGNPQCVNFLGQARLESATAALASYLDAAGLGSSPLDNAREPDLPVGLKQLVTQMRSSRKGLWGLQTGIYLLTPFIRSFKQVWFQDRAFRDGVYKCKPSQEEGKDLEESPIFQLQVTFAALQESTQNVFNPVKLVESLQLRASEQQDAQEFSKLFMSHLATEFEKQAVSSLKTLLADQFEGKQTYGTMCKKCQHRSERDSDFLELEINIEANGRLEDRIKAYLQSEELTGDNKYYCTKCDGLQDAIRYTKLRRLPPVLHISVLRFVFDVATLLRKKSKQAIHFPTVLDMSPFLDAEISGSAQVPSKRACPDSQCDPNLIYDLRGVLLHKGASAYHGHYEAQVFDVTTKQFYQFNDETVTPLSSLQGKSAISGNQDASETAVVNKQRKTNARKKRRVDDSDGEAENDILQRNTPNYVSSKDAYMLIYARREAQTAYNGNKHGPSVPEPPPMARERVNKLNKEHDDACASFTTKKDKLTADFELMRERKRAVYRHWHIEDMKEESAVVSRSALEDWLTEGLEKPKKKKKSIEAESDSKDPTTPSSRCSSRPPDIADQGEDPMPPSGSDDPLDLLAPTPPPQYLENYRLDNASITCHHGGLDPSKTGEMKRIKKDALASIRNSGWAVDLDLTTNDICQLCVENLFIEKRYVLDHSSQVELFNELCESDNGVAGAWISKAWVKDWKQAKPRMHVVGQSDPDPEASDYVDHVKCPHGALSQAPSLRKWINADACTFLQSLFPNWQPVISRSDEHPQCSPCEDDLSLSKENRQELKQRVDREKDKLKELATTNLYAYIESSSTPGVRKAIIGVDFLRRWRAWISRPQEKPRPDAIDNTWLICKHDNLVVDPSIPEDLKTSVSLISMQQWASLQELYGGGPVITWAAPAEDDIDIVFSDDNERNLDQQRYSRLSNFETATIYVRLSTEDTDGKTESRDVTRSEVTESPPKENGRKHSAITYAHKRRHGVQPLRMSDRLRKAKFRDLIVTKSSTVKEIKMELQDAFNIPTICQRLYLKGVELTDNSETVRSLAILAHDTLDLRVEKEGVLDSDVEAEHPRQPRDEGRAFGGTILSGGGVRKTSVPASDGGGDRESSPEAVVVVIPRNCPMCTFINPDDHTICTMCGSLLESS
ncbi:cysteine proteinase [Hysterangium stoloniferum]|nr:cysteine proteinase [Hysterangium stoloniferum]